MTQLVFANIDVREIKIIAKYDHGCTMVSCQYPDRISILYKWLDQLSVDMHSELGFRYIRV